MTQAGQSGLAQVGRRGQGTAAGRNFRNQERPGAHTAILRHPREDGDLEGLVLLTLRGFWPRASQMPSSQGKICPLDLYLEPDWIPLKPGL